jgi:hypothetical protein
MVTHNGKKRVMSVQYSMTLYESTSSKRSGRIKLRGFWFFYHIKRRSTKLDPIALLVQKLATLVELSKEVVDYFDHPVTTPPAVTQTIHETKTSFKYLYYPVKNKE